MILEKLDLSKGTGGRNYEYVYTAPNRVVVTSSMPTYSNSTLYWMEYLFDDPTLENYWLTSGGPATLTFDLGSLKNRDIRRIEVTGATRTDSYSLYSIWVSDDNVEYKEIVKETGSNIIKEKLIFDVNTEKKRFIQFRLRYIGNWGVQLRNIDFFVSNNERRSVIKDGLNYKVLKNNVLEIVGTNETPITQEWLNVNGMLDIFELNKAHIAQIESDVFEIITSNTEETAINNIEIKGVAKGNIVYSNFNYLIEDIKNIEIIDSYIENETCIPATNSYITPIGKVIVSSEYNSYYYAYQLFNRKKDGYAAGWFAKNPLRIDKSQWAGFEFNEPTIIQGYGVRRNSYPDYSRSEPVDWTFEGFDGEKWIVLHTIQNYSFKTYDIEKFNALNTTAYLKYRINITKVKDMNYYAGLDELELYKGIKNTGLVKVFYSSDDGLNWEGKEKINTNNMDDVKAKSFTLNEFTLAFDEIKKKASNNQIRLAFYLENTDINTEAAIYGIKINKAVHDVTPILNDITLIKNMNKPMNNPKIYVSTNSVTWNEIKINELEKIAAENQGSEFKIKVELKDGQELYAICYSWV